MKSVKAVLIFLLLFPQIKQKSSGRTGGNFKRSFFGVFSFFVFCRKTDRIQKRETESLKFIVKLLNSINYGII